ncbi:MAG: hypothetical protein LBH05_00875 [Deferribacteraceae bacterium]|jgi:hypothetical protein|nr:hypothetical protein [Deferribacteraceae bacterium]
MFKILQGTVAESVVVMLNTSFNVDISEDELVHVFKTGKTLKEWAQHIGRFYNELHIEVIIAFIQEYGISKSNFSFVHTQLPSCCQNPSFGSLINKVYK